MRISCGTRAAARAGTIAATGGCASASCVRIWRIGGRGKAPESRRLHRCRAFHGCGLRGFRRTVVRTHVIWPPLAAGLARLVHLDCLSEKTLSGGGSIALRVQ
eukprot:scaffold7752_cov34-Prasinocladus_malaysianus.AAC.1